MRLHAVISKGTRAASKTKKFQPAANPNASSTYLPAKRMNGLDIGRYVTYDIISTPNPWAVYFLS